EGFSNLTCHAFFKTEFILQPLGAAARGHSQHLFRLHPHAGSAALARQADAHSPCAESLHIVAHERFVHGADLLHIERPVRKPLPAQYNELLQHAVDGAVAERWYIYLSTRLRVTHRSTATAPTF